MKNNCVSGLGLVNNALSTAQRTARRRRSISCAAALLVTQAAYAATPNWTPAGNGNWTDARWTAGMPVAGDTATFNDTGLNGAETVFLNGNQAAANLVFNNTAATTLAGGISGTPATNTLTLTGGINVASTAGAVSIGLSTANVNTVLDGAAPSVITLKNDSTTGVLTFAGTITSSGTGARTLTLDGSGTSTFTGAVSDIPAAPISLVKTGSGAWQIIANSYTGGTTLSSGTLVLGSNNALGTAAQTLTILGGTITADTGSGRALPAAIGISIAGNFAISGNAKDTDFNGPTSLNSGAGGAVRTITVNNGGATWGGIVSDGGAGPGGIIKAGASSLTLTNSGNTYSGLTTVSAGNFIWGANNVIGTGGLTIVGSSTTANMGSAAAHTDTVGTVTLASGTLTSTTAGSVLTSTTSFEIQSGTVAAGVSLAGTAIPVNKTNVVSTTNLTATFAGANSYTGDTNIRGGILQIGASGALGSGNLNITGNTTTDAGARVALANGVSISNPINIGINTGVGSRDILEANSNSIATFSGPINITALPTAGGHIGAATSTGTLVLSGVITSSVIVSQRLGTVIYSGGGTGYSTLWITGTGQVGATDGISTVATVNVGVSGANDTFDLHGFNQTIAALANNPANAASTLVTNNGAGPSVLTVGNGGGSNNYNATIQSGTSVLGVTKIGAGTQVFSGFTAYTGNTNVSAGILAFQSNLLTSANLNVTGGQLQLSDSGTHNRLINTGAVSVTGGSIDLADNKLITTTALGTIQTYIANGRNGGTWNASGMITSESNAQGGSALTTLAVANANDVGYNATRSFSGQNVTGAETLVMYTYGGDANLDGQVTGDDYARIDAGFASVGGLTGYENGDFNYDGKINADDYFIIDKNYSTQSTPFPNAPGIGGLSGVSAVPEPASISILALGAIAALKRRRRQP